MIQKGIYKDKPGLCSYLRTQEICHYAHHSIQSYHYTC